MTLAFDRHLAIKHPIKFRKFSTGNYAWKFISAIWLTSLAIMLPLCIVRQVRFIYPFGGITSNDLPYCIEKWSSEDARIAYGFLLCVFLFVLPTLVLVYSYSVIGKQLWRESAGIQEEVRQRKINQAQLHKVMLNRRKVARMLVILALLFAVCWIPYYINSIYLDFIPAHHTSAHRAYGALSFTSYLGHFNSAINPILYCFMNATFRRSAKKLFCRSCYRKKLNKTKEGNVCINHRLSLVFRFCSLYPFFQFLRCIKNKQKHERESEWVCVCICSREREVKGEEKIMCKERKEERVRE